ncbi:MAG: GDYXXLXY domain-containing protein [Candidatus Omnitrophica bacterium]|nr:GDYXXLXY domain-containing protein [Candidatus Omnitrophota bacterium]
MNNKKWLLGCFLCLALVQLFVPAWIIIQREMTLRNGQPFRFQTDPISVKDIFDKRSISLPISQNPVPKPSNIQLFPNQLVYVLVDKDDQGFARIESLSLHKPKGNDFFKAEVDYVKGRQVYLNLPFDRYYLEEKPFPAVSDDYQKNDRKAPQEGSVVVRIDKGRAVLEELYIEGKPVLEFLENFK